MDNQNMDINKIVARNLSEWMRDTPALSSLQKVKAKSGVGFGTIRRARNGDGNTTIQNLHDIAKAFGKGASDLLHDSQPRHAVEQDRASFQKRPRAYMEIIDIIDAASEEDLLLGLGALRAALTPSRPKNFKRRSG